MKCGNKFVIFRWENHRYKFKWIAIEFRSIETFWMCVGGCFSCCVHTITVSTENNFDFRCQSKACDKATRLFLSNQSMSLIHRAHFPNAEIFLASFHVAVRTHTAVAQYGIFNILSYPLWVEFSRGILWKCHDSIEPQGLKIIHLNMQKDAKNTTKCVYWCALCMMTCDTVYSICNLSSTIFESAHFEPWKSCFLFLSLINKNYEKKKHYRGKLRVPLFSPLHRHHNENAWKLANVFQSVCNFTLFLWWGKYHQ